MTNEEAKKQIAELEAKVTRLTLAVEAQKNGVIRKIDHLRVKQKLEDRIKALEQALAASQQSMAPIEQELIDAKVTNQQLRAEIARLDAQIRDLMRPAQPMGQTDPIPPDHPALNKSPAMMAAAAIMSSLPKVPDTHILPQIQEPPHRQVPMGMVKEAKRRAEMRHKKYGKGD